MACIHKILTVIPALLILLIISCQQDSKTKSDTALAQTENSYPGFPSISESHDTVTLSKFIDTRYEFTDEKGNSLLIENSLPKGGKRYTDPNGDEFTYAVFWTRIKNETDSRLNFLINIPSDSFNLPSEPDNYFKLVLPAEEMMIENTTKINYGLLNLEAVLANKLQNTSSLDKRIPIGGAASFYVIALFRKGVKGRIRAGLSLVDDDLIYRVNDQEIKCGIHNFKELE